MQLLAEPYLLLISIYDMSWFQKFSSAIMQPHQSVGLWLGLYNIDLIRNPVNGQGVNSGLLLPPM